MKKSIIIIFMILQFTCGLLIQLYGQETPTRLNLPGDNLNLYAVLKIFQESETLEIFEKKLNTKENNINNLDLNLDDQIDYIKIKDQVDGNVHNIILQDIVNANELQDVAVIIVEKIQNNQVQIQIIGDEDLYGKDYIIEPNFETKESELNSTPNPGFTAGTSRVIQKVYTSTYTLYNWPIVQYIYLPSYDSWNSPYHWGLYPSYWQPWTPLYWHEYYGWQYHWGYYYFANYRRWNHCRYNHWNEFYYSHRRQYSPSYLLIKTKEMINSTYSKPELEKRGSDNYKKQFPNSPSSLDKPHELKDFKRKMITEKEPIKNISTEEIPKNNSVIKDLKIKNNPKLKESSLNDRVIESDLEKTKPNLYTKPNFKNQPEQDLPKHNFRKKEINIQSESPKSLPSKKSIHQLKND